jgi:hypothetical protein
MIGFRFSNHITSSIENTLINSSLVNYHKTLVELETSVGYIPCDRNLCNNLPVTNSFARHNSFYDDLSS